MDSIAKKRARDEWNQRNPISNVRLPQDRYDALKQAANDMDVTYHGLLKQIVTEWLEKENR